MKIAIISTSSPFDKRSVSGIIYQMTEQLKKDNEIVWINANINANIIIWVYKVFCKILFYNYYTTHLHTKFYSKIACRHILPKIKREKPDLLFCFGCFNIAYLNIKSIPIVYRTDAVYQDMINYYYFKIPKLFIKEGNRIEKKALDKSDFILLPSKWVKEGAIKHYSISDSKLMVIESGANINNHDFPTKVFSQSSLKLLFIGIDIYRKGIDVAIETNNILRTKYNIDSTLTVVGKVGNTINKYVKWIGFLNKNNKEEYKILENIMKDSDCFLLPTKAECAGIVFAEASAFGLPIYTYDTGGIGNYVINGVNGYRLNTQSSASDFAKCIYNSLINNEMKKLSKGGISLYNNVLNWNHWKEQFDKLITNRLKK